MKLDILAVVSSRRYPRPRSFSLELGIKLTNANFARVIPSHTPQKCMQSQLNVEGPQDRLCRGSGSQILTCVLVAAFSLFESNTLDAKTGVGVGAQCLVEASLGFNVNKPNFSKGLMVRSLVSFRQPRPLCRAQYNYWWQDLKTTQRSSVDMSSLCMSSFHPIPRS